MTGKLARVRWKMGQALLPEHFVAQEEALLAHSQLRSKIGGLPSYGFASLRWNDSLLSEGVGDSGELWREYGVAELRKRGR